MAKQASPSWIALRSYIEGLPVSQIMEAGRALSAHTASAQDLKREAYNHAKRNELSYAQVHAKLAEHMAQQTRELERETGETKLDVSNEGDWQAAVAKLAEAFEGLRNGAGLDVAAVRKIAREELGDIALQRIEITAKGEKIAELDGAQHKQLPTLLKLCATRQGDGFIPAIWIAGPPGAGKTHAARTVAKAYGREFHFDGALSMSHEVLGFRDATGKFHETAFFKGYTSPSVYLFDECDGSENGPLLSVNAALANGYASFPVGLRERHADSIIMAGANTWGFGATSNFIGRAKLDGAFLDRFPVKLFWDYDTALELRLCGNADWARKVQAARTRAREAGLQVMITPRATIAGAALIRQGFTLEEAASFTYLANLTAEQKGML